MSEGGAVDTIFKCRMCGYCCKGYGGTFVTAADIEAIATHIGVSAETFEQQYCVYSGGKPMLAQNKDGYCIFWDKLCAIHPVKPRMCRQWPYLPSVLVDIQNWFTMAADCPGIRTDLAKEVICDVIRRKNGPRQAD